MGWIVWRHRSNLARLRAGTENRFEKKELISQSDSYEHETSNSSRTIKVGILGFGTVGQGTWKHLKENASFWPKILGVNLEPSRASVRTLDNKDLWKSLRSN